MSMFLRPRHVSAAATTPTTRAVDGDSTRLASMLEGEREVGGLPEEKRQRNSNSIISRQIRYQRQSMLLKVHHRLRAGGVTCSGKNAVLAVCSAWCMWSAFSVLLFALLRTLAMASAGPAATAAAHAADTATADNRRNHMFTVLVNTFERPRQMEEAVRHYAGCPGVESVRVAWSEPAPPPTRTTSPGLFNHPSPVRIHAYPTTSINNRFIPPADLMTEAVFVVDDDIAVSCTHLLAAFQTWKQHKGTLVGFFVRSHAYQPPSSPTERGDEGAGLWEYLYFWRVLWRNEYSIVLTKAAFVHAKYLELYSGSSGDNGRDVGTGEGRVDGDDTSAGYRQRPGDADSDWSEAIVKAMTKTRAYVDSRRNCEDIAMQMAVTSVSGLPPVAAFAPVVDIGLLGGISTGEGSGKWWQAPHAMKRSRCLADLHEIFCAARAADALLLSPSTSDDDDTTSDDGGPRPTGWPAEVHEPRPSHCEVLIPTNLFAAASRGTVVSAGVAPHMRGGSRERRRGVVHHGIGGTIDGGEGGDLVRLSRLALAVRAPTLAEFVSADMLLVPGKMWKWFAKDNLLGRA